MNAPVARPRRKTLEVLLDEGRINADQARIVLMQHAHAKAHGRAKSVGALVIDNGFAARNEVSDAVKQTGGQNADAATLTQTLLPFHVCLRYQIVPWGLDGATLIIQSRRKLSPAVTRLVVETASERFAGQRITALRHRAAFASQIQQSLAAMRQVTSAGLGETLLELEANLEDGVLMARAISEIFITAASRRASDVHVEWDDQVEDMSWIKFRVDGDLRPEYLLSRAIAAALTRRLKDLSGMDIGDSRHSQDGRHSFEYVGRVIDVRVNAQPTIVGETITMRLLDPASLRAMSELFPGQDDICRHLSEITNVKGKEAGLVLLSGPTGQGKTTTLYAMIRGLPRDKRKVVTIEDPVEYKVPHVTQISFNPFIHTSMSEILKAAKRQDPDMVVVGETRDPATAALSLEVANSGHLVFTTLHTSDCFQALPTLVDMHPGGAVEALLPIANNLLASIHQMLAKRVCVHCGEMAEVPLDHPMRSVYGVTAAMRGRGCEQCGHSGYLGRVAVPEAIFVARRDDTRRVFVEHLRAGGTLRNLPPCDGIALFPRSKAVIDLIGMGAVDHHWGARMLGLANA